MESARVLMLIENLSYPWDRRMRNLSRALHEAGFGVSVICPKGENCDRAGFEVIDGIRVYRYPKLCEASGALGYLVEYGWALLCTAILMPVLALREGFDCIHSANPPDLFFLLAWPWKLLGKKFIYDQHDLSPELYESKFGRRDFMYKVLLWLERMSYRTADLVIATNASYREIALDRGHVKSENAVIVRNGVDLREFHQRTPRPALKGGFTFLAFYVGVMGKQDGVDRIILAADHLVHRLHRSEVLFVLAGKGESWQGLQELSRELHVDHVVRFPGRISDDELLDYLATADVCLAPDPPDRMNQLSTMTKIMEYMGCGKPIVSFDLLESRRSAAYAAVYVEGDNPVAFAEEINRLLDDPARRRRMGQIGVDRTMHVVGLNVQRKALVDAYCRLTGRVVAEEVAEEMEAVAR